MSQTKMINRSGMHPVGELLLVQVVEMEERTKGGIVLAADTRHKEELSQTAGMLIEMGPTSETYHPNSRAKGRSPGDIVMFAKFAGKYQLGRDGKGYRTIRPDDLLGWIELQAGEKMTSVLDATGVVDIVNKTGVQGEPHERALTQ